MSTNWKSLLTSAWQRRQLLLEGDSNCWRLFHGYDEGFPGVVIEKFDKMAIIEYKSDIRESLLEIKDTLLELFPFTFVLAKGHQSLTLSLKERMFPLHGDYSAAPEYVTEGSLKFSLVANATHNHGLYLDARDVRKWLLDNSKDRRVLNLFAFTGSLGLASLKGGAKEVIHLDRSKDLVPRIEENYKINEAKFDNRNFLRGDIYKHLPKAIKSGQKFDGIILDPPPKVYQSPHASHRPHGQDFNELVKLCTKLLNPGAWLICLFHRFEIPWDEFEEQVIRASEGQLESKQRFNSGIDFPETNGENKLRVSVFYQ